MIALLILPLIAIFALSNLFDDELQELQDISDDNGLKDYDPDAPSVYDGRTLEFGTNEAEVINGTPGDDAIFALGQSDVVRALAGDDLVEAGSNDDTVFGGRGDDIIGGGTGADALYGEAGDDILLGNAGNDLLVGRDGADLLVGGGGLDSLNGGRGDDILISGLPWVGSDQDRLDLSATAVAAILAQPGADPDAELENADLAQLQASGAFNGVDLSFLTESGEATQGGALSGGEGDDLLILAGGDTASGGAGDDTFVLNEDMARQRTVLIEDFAPRDDMIALEYRGNTAPDVDVLDRDGDAVIFLNDAIIARVTGGAGLSSGDVRLIEVR